MTKTLPVSDDKKLRVIYRVEPGCLGPDGRKTIEDFCHFAQPQIQLPVAPAPDIGTGLVSWADLIICQLLPRNDKKLPELQYQINNKSLSHEKAAKYIAMFDRQLNDFEDEIHEKLADLIDTHLARRSKL